MALFAVAFVGVRLHLIISQRENLLGFENTTRFDTELNQENMVALQVSFNILLLLSLLFGLGWCLFVLEMNPIMW